ncbi:threonine/serine exporter family protein [Azospira inquinata]|uniref:Threonine/serine exporter family protein n=1 Tax=Azospira inquinata TaxID=2785627 RepID=A0A975XTU7_9RHOO|nr:threonine/serine exporter family protein [Azospira inquinata]QWT46571.1 threonine/serine exporter family protein [Azospira inquinata]QWT48107.1 threonine/serine exporter family protein [Azospira inquinata]
MDALHESIHALLRFGEQFLQAGSTAYRTREAMLHLAPALGIDSLHMKMDLRCLVATARRGEERVTLVREIGAPGVDSRELKKLQHFVLHTPPHLDAATVHGFLDRVSSARRLHGPLLISLTTGAACGAFAFLNGGGATEISAAALAAAVGQGLRSLLHRRHLSPYAIYTLCGLAASGLYVVLAQLLVLLGVDSQTRHSAGFVSAVLFLVPGFPMVSAALDLLRQETNIALARLVHVLMLLFMAALGLAAVIALAGITLDTAPPPQLSLGALTGARVLASFVGACGFALLFNESFLDALFVGLLAIIGNGLRLWLRDGGVSLPLATFLGALVVGLLVSLLLRRLAEPRITLTVPAVIMMVPGVYTFETLVRFNEGSVLAALGTGVQAAFVVVTMGMGLAVSRFLSEKASRRERGYTGRG